MLCPAYLVAEEEYEEMDDYFGDEEYNEKESEEGKQIILLLWVNTTLSVLTIYLTISANQEIAN